MHKFYGSVQGKCIRVYYTLILIEYNQNITTDCIQKYSKYLDKKYESNLENGKLDLIKNLFKNLRKFIWTTFDKRSLAFIYKRMHTRKEVKYTVFFFVSFLSKCQGKIDIV